MRMAVTLSLLSLFLVGADVASVCVKVARSEGVDTSGGRGGWSNGEYIREWPGGMCWVSPAGELALTVF